MAGKDKMGDIQEVVNMVKSHYPDFNITPEMLITPSSPSLILFFTEVKKELTERSLPFKEALQLTSEPGDDLITLYCFIRNLAVKLSINSFHLTDILQPTPKRTRFFIKTIIHFLMYAFNECMDDVDQISSAAFEMTERKSQLQEEKEQLLEEIAEKSKTKAENEHNIAGVLEENNTLITVHEEVIISKREHEKIWTEQDKLTENLQSQLEMDQYQLSLLETEKSDLEKLVVTEQDYESMLNMEKILKEKLDSFDFVKGVEVCLDETDKNIKLLTLLNEMLEKIDFEVLVSKITQLDKDKGAKQKIEEGKENCIERMSHLKLKATVLLDKRNSLKNDLNYTLENFESIRNAIHKQLQTFEKNYETNRKALTNIKSQCDDLVNISEFLQDSISEIESNKTEFKKSYEIEYKKILDKMREVLNFSNEIFHKIREKSSNCVKDSEGHLECGDTNGSL